MENTTGVPSSGNLSHTSPIHLYYLAAALNSTGLLTLQLPDRTLVVHFRKGNPEFVDSNHAEDSISSFLLKAQAADAHQLQEAEKAKERFGGELVSALLGLNLLQPAPAFAQLSRRAGLLLSRALATQSGAFNFKPGELQPQRSMPLGNRWSVLLDSLRLLSIAEIERRLLPIAQFPVMKSGGRIQISDLKLNPRETRAFANIDGVRSLSTLCLDHPNEKETYCRLVFALKDLELLSFPAAPPKLEPARPANTPPAAAVQSSPSPPANLGADLLAAKEFAASLKQKNFFEIFGATEKTDIATIKGTYFQLAKLYHPDTLPPNAPAELAKLKSDIFGVIGEAYRTLAEENSRAEYIETLQPGGGDRVDVANILLAEEAFRKGSLFVKARRFPEAVKALDEAIGANPDEPEFYAWRGYAKFFLHTDKAKGRNEALADIQKCLKTNDRVAPGHYFLGQIAKLMGNNAEAATHFKRAVELQPNHVDAQRELRILNKNKGP